MPHVIIEYSENAASEIQSCNAVRIAHTAMIESGLFQTRDIKTRAYPAHNFLVGDKGMEGRFVHASVYLLEGRTTEQKQALSQNIFHNLSEKMQGIDSITVDIRELEKSTYRKIQPKT